MPFCVCQCQDLNTPGVLRQSAASYISSFVARSKFVSLDTIKLCLTVVTEWIHRYVLGVDLIYVEIWWNGFVSCTSGFF